MGAGFDNINRIADKPLAYIADTGGFRQLFQVESYSFNTEGGVTNVSGPAGVIGTTRQAGGYAMSVTTRFAKDAPEEVDWDGLRLDDEYFRFEIQVVGGVRYQLVDCRVSTISNKFSSDSVSREISLVAPRLNVITP